MVERLRNLLYSTDHTLQERLFILGGAAGTIALLAVFMMSVSIGDVPVVSAMLLITAIILPVVMIWSYNRRNIKVGGTLVVLVLCGFIIPFGYIMGGGVNSGSSLWFVLGIMFVFMVFDGKLMVALTVFVIGSLGFVTYLEAFDPDIVVQIASKYGRFHDSFLATSVVGLIAGMLLRFQYTIFERENKISSEQRAEIERLNEAQNSFFSSMSHEIRTPINTIIGLNEMILRDKNISEEAAENAVNIENAGKMLLALINDILDMSKIESGNMEVIEEQYETSHMFSEIVNLLWNRAREKDLRFEINIGENIPSMLYGDEMKLKQVIINLLTNAIKYTEEGSVTLSVDGEHTGPNDFLLKIDVEDTGVGIRKESIPYLFDTFKRVDESENKAIEGTGLGLAISKQLVELMGGSITVDSVYTKGSTFHVEVKQKIVDGTPMALTIKKDSAADRKEYQQVFEAPEAHVLIVDDNDMNRMVARKLLRATKVQVDLAASGRECLDKTTKIRYDAIFMDHEMPQMDGVETLRRVRSQNNGLCKDTPVIALTANAGADMHNYYMNRGFQAYIAKPIHGSLMEATLMQFLPAELIERTADIPEEEVFQVSAVRHKKPIQITADCICDLPFDMLSENEIRIMPYYIQTEAGRFRDVEEIDSDNLFTYLESGKRAVTEAGSVDEYEAFFADNLAEAEAVIHISASSKISSGYDAAVRAGESFDNVYVVDSKNLCSGIGLVALKAAELVRAGNEPDEITQKLEEYTKRVKLEFLITDLSGMTANNRAGKLMSILSEAFSLEYGFAIRNGAIRLRKAHIGYVVGARRKFIRNACRSMGKADRKRIFVDYAGCTVQEQEEIVSDVKRYSSFNDVILHKVSATIASNTGMHAVALAYVDEEKR